MVFYLISFVICHYAPTSIVLLAEIGVFKPTSTQFQSPNNLYQTKLPPKEALLEFLLFFCLYWHKLLFYVLKILHLNK